MSYIVTSELVESAVEAILPTFAYYEELGAVNKYALWIVVMDPAKPFGTDCTFQDAILHQCKIGAPKELYGRVARSKAEISWRTGLPSHVVQQVAPYLLAGGDTKWGGSAVTQEGLIVACSGVEWFMDQHMSEMIASAIKVASIFQMQLIMANSDMTFLGVEGD